MWLSTTIGLVLLLPAAAPEKKAQPQTPADVRRWVNQLGSDDFQARREAAARLTGTGLPAIEPLIAAAGKNDLEVSVRALQVLLSIGTNGDDKAAMGAGRALEQLSRSDNSAVAARAAQMLGVFRYSLCKNSARRAIDLGGYVELDVQGEKPVLVRELNEIPGQAVMLRAISFRSSKTLRDADLRAFRNAGDLTSLQLTNTRITDAGLNHLRGFVTLRALYLERTQTTGRGLASLSNLRQLERLWLNGTGVTDQGLSNLAQFKRLTSLDLEGTKVGDDGLIHLRSLTNLTALGLRDTKVGDAGLRHLKTLSKLQSLSLAGTGVTDAGLVHLQKMAGLEFVDLRWTDVSPKDAEKLREELGDAVVRVSVEKSR